MTITPAVVMNATRALLNDQIGAIFSDTVLLPYYNMATKTLEEAFQLNNIPVTNASSSVIATTAGVFEIGFSTFPALPPNLIEIRELWETPSGQINFIPMGRRIFLPLYDNPPISQFLIYSWNDQKINLIPANSDIDLKIDYIQNLFADLSIDEINTPLTILGAQLFLQQWTAGLAAQFIGENEQRAQLLYALANQSLYRSLNIRVKSSQQTIIKHLPYRQAYKRRQVW